MDSEEQSFKDRLGSSKGTAVGGFFVFGFSFYLLGSNERRAVETAETIDAARKAVVQTATCTPDPMNDGKLVSMVSCAVAPGNFSGQSVAGRVVDDVLVAGIPGGSTPDITLKGFIGDDVLSWDRRAEQYQYLETKRTSTKKSGGGKTTSTTTYSYTKGWSSSHETWSCSSGCRDKCRSDLGSTETCEVTTWDSTLAKTTAGQVDKIYLSDSSSNGNSSSLFIGGNPWGNARVSSIGPSRDLTISLSNGGATLSACDSEHVKYSPTAQSTDCTQRIADWRWRWSYRTVPQAGVSVLAQQVPMPDGSGSTFVEWTTGEDVTWLAVNSIGKVQEGACDGDCMLDGMEDSNTVLTWVLRFGGTLCMWLGITCMLHPIAVAPAFIPVIGDMLEGFIGKILAAFACLCAGALSFFTIGLAWLVYRPLLAAALLALCCCCMGGAAFVGYTAYTKNKSRKSDPQTQWGAPPAQSDFVALADA